MKKITSFIFICFLYAALSVAAFAEDFVNPPVTDGAGYLSEEQLSTLSQRLEEIRQKYSFDVAIVTENEMSGYDARNVADDIFDYGGYGAGVNDDGILLYICSGTRDYWLTTHADGMRVFNENGIEYLKNNIQPLLAEDDYYLAMETYADLADELLKMAQDGKPFNKKQYSMEYILIVLGCALILPLIIAWIMMGAKLSAMKTAVKNEYAGDYMKPGSKVLTNSRDIFLYSHITKTEKPKNNSSGSHTSSSGRTHGGGGGKF